MTVYTVTTSNWNNSAFWSAISEAGPGHTLDFSGLPSSFDVDFWPGSDRIIISDGATSFVIGDIDYGWGDADATLGGSTQLDYFTTVIGSQGEDTLDGGTNNDTINSGAGNDFVNGNGGADSINAGDGNDNVDGGAGNDVIGGDAGNDTLDGGADNDTIYAGTGDDSILGGAGNDEIYTEVGNDTVWAGDGDDSVYGWYVDSNLKIHGEGGNDVLFGSSGNDTITGDAGNDSIEGGDGDDSIDGGTGNDTIYDYAGNATIRGGTGDDYIDGDDDADTFIIEENFGNDTILGGEGGTDSDTIDASALTSDLTLTFSANETATLTDGSDTLTMSQIENVFTGSGDDLLDASLDSSGIGLFSGAGNDTIAGGSGADYVEGGDGDDSIFGDAGDDTIQAGIGNDSVIGGLGLDSISGGDGNDTLSGGGNSDQLSGGSGNDVLDGGTENDTIDGGDGDDTLLAGLGLDSFIGGSGNDVLDIANSSVVGYAFNIDLAAGTDTYGNTYSGIETILGGNLNDTLTGDGDDNLLEGGGGNDLLDGRGGNDTLDGGAGDDTLMGGWGIGEVMIGGTGTDTYQIDGTAVEGYAYDINLTTGLDQYGKTFSGIENVIGGDNNDTLTGNTEDNLLEGRDGADTFNVLDTFGNDTIIGGEGGTDDDTLDLTALTGPVTVTYTGDEAGTITDGTYTITFSEIEQIILDEQNDSLDGSATSQGMNVDLMGGNDTAIGTDQGDTIAGGDGDDYIEGGLGNDFLTTGEGQDTLMGGDGADTLMNSDGDDSLDGGAGDDSIVATGGEDTLRGGTGDDYMDGGDDADTFIIEDSFGNDTIIGGEGTTDPGDTDYDTIDLSMMTGPVTVTYTGDEAGTITDGTDTITFSEIERVITTDQNDSVDGSAQWPGLFSDAPGMNVETRGGNDTVTGGRGGDTIDAGTGNDSIDGDYGDDSIDGGDGSDTLLGGTGNDTLAGGAGNDSLSAGVEDDTLTGGTGDDTLTGGDGDDTFIYNVGDGADTITDFNTGNTGALGDGDSTNNDFIDLGSFYDNLTELREDFNDDGVLNQSNSISNGGTVDYSDNSEMQPGDSLTFQGADQSSFTADNTGVVCFTTGTAIRTPRGDVLIDDLKVGDLVTTMDNGPQRIAWIGKRHVTRSELFQSDRLHPVLIKKGILGAERDLLVSRQHGMLLGQDYLGRAVHLAKTMPGVRLARGARQVTYVHLMFEAHQIIFAEGIPSESFYPGPMALEMLSNASREEMRLIFPKLTAMVGREDIIAAYGNTARAFLENKKAVSAWLNGGSGVAKKEIREWDVDMVMEQFEAERMFRTVAPDQVRNGMCQVA